MYTSVSGTLWGLRNGIENDIHYKVNKRHKN